MRVMTTLLVVCAALYGSSNAGVASVERPPSPRPWWTGQLDAPRFSGRAGFPSPAAPFQTVDLKVDGYGLSKVDGYGFSKVDRHGFLKVAGDSPGQAPARPRPAATECAGKAMLGLDADTLTAAARTRLSVPGDVTGVVVTHVFADGPAARAGVQVGDLLVAVDGTPVSDACALTLVAFTRPDCEDAHVTAWRAGQSRTLIIAPADATSVLEKRCSSGDSQACFRRAWLIWSVHKTGPEFARALDRFGTSCRGGSAAGCAY